MKLFMVLLMFLLMALAATATEITCPQRVDVTSDKLVYSTEDVARFTISYDTQSTFFKTAPFTFSVVSGTPSSPGSTKLLRPVSLSDTGSITLSVPIDAYEIGSYSVKTGFLPIDSMDGNGCPSVYGTTVFSIAQSSVPLTKESASCGYACCSDHDCDDAKESTYDLCALPGQTDSVCINALASCETLVKTGDPSTNLDIVFIPNGFAQNELLEFKGTLKDHISLILGTEPFRSYSNRINFYFLRTTENLQSAYSLVYKLRQHLVTLCEGADELITLSHDKNQGVVLSMDGKASHHAISSIYSPWVTVHELGHSFGNLGDTYVGWMSFDGNPGADFLSTVNTQPNIDVGGCPKWCKSNTGPYSTECTEIPDELSCRQHERTLQPFNDQTHWSCNDPIKCCVWLTEPDPFFKTQCVNFRDDKNIGTDCFETSGCYYGAGSAQMIWRSSNSENIMGDDTMKAESFDAVSEQALRAIFERCDFCKQKEVTASEPEENVEVSNIGEPKLTVIPEVEVPNKTANFNQALNNSESNKEGITKDKKSTNFIAKIFSWLFGLFH